MNVVPMARFPATALLLAALVALLLAAPGAASARRLHHCRATQAIPTAATVARARIATLCLLNNERARHHLGPLRSNTRLWRAATRYARDMTRRKFFDHVGPGGSTLVGRISSVGYISRNRAWRIGENIAYGTGHYATPASTVRMWMHSPGHRANILRGSFHEIGIGIAPGAPVHCNGRSATYTTDFGGLG